MDLLWLWILLGVLGSGILAAGIYMIVNHYKNKEEKPKPTIDTDLTEWDWETGQEKLTIEDDFNRSSSEKEIKEEDTWDPFYFKSNFKSK